jgi:hypothetical protein
MLKNILRLWLLLGLVNFPSLFGALPETKTGLKIFISADIEGVAGVVNSAQTSSSGEEYQKACSSWCLFSGASPGSLAFSPMGIRQRTDSVERG